MVESSADPRDALKQRIMFIISCRKLKDLDVMSKSDPLVEVHVKSREGVYNLIGKTE